MKNLTFSPTAAEKQKVRGKIPDENRKLHCDRCNRYFLESNFYTYKDGSKCEICKPCLTAHIDNFDPSTFEWILEKMDVPYIPPQWDILRDRAFAKDPYKMTGMSVMGKYLAKMRLKKWSSYGYADSERVLEELKLKEDEKQAKNIKAKEGFDEELKEKLKNGEISEAEYKTFISTESQKKDFEEGVKRDVITGTTYDTNSQLLRKPTSYEQALDQIKNPFQEENFISQEQLLGDAAQLSHDDVLYLALKWGRLYRPSQWIALEKMYNDFMQSFDIQGAARIDTLKMICKTSLKMNEAINQEISVA